MLKIKDNNKCELCVKRKTMYCPNSSECYSLDNLPEFKTKLDILKENDNLNKGIDELIKKYEYELEHLDRNKNLYEKGVYDETNCILEDLKKLKGETK